MNRKVNLGLAGWCLAGSAAIFAQSTGRLTGNITDASGAAVPSATVNLYMIGGRTAVQTAPATSDGLFSFSAIQPGSYDISVEAAGFAKFTYRAAVVNAARETVVPTIKLELKSVQQTVEVTGDAQTVQTANIENSTSVTKQQVANLPVLDRQVSNLFLTQPGVSSGRGHTTVNGLRTSRVNATFEGVQ